MRFFGITFNNHNFSKRDGAGVGQAGVTLEPAISEHITRLRNCEANTALMIYVRAKVTQRCGAMNVNLSVHPHVKKRHTIGVSIGPRRGQVTAKPLFYESKRILI